MANIIIIGAGVAGLSAGIYAQLSGHHATIYERHFKAGGNLTGWDREGYHIDNCIHWLTGTNPNTKLYSIWKDLGVLDNVKIYQGESLYTFRKDGIEISLYDDINKTKEEMLRIGKEDKEEIEKFIKAVEIIKGLEGTKGLENNQTSNFIEKIKGIPLLFRYYKMSTKDLADKFQSPILKGFIISLISEQFSSIALLVIFATFSGKNGGIPEGASCGMAERMCQRFKSLGGTLYLNKEVKKINIEGNKVKSITLEDDKIKEADYVIVTIDPAIAFSKLMNRELMPKKLEKQYLDKRMMRFSSYHCAYACEEKELPFKGDIIFEIPSEYREKLHSKYLIVREFSFEKSFAPEGKNILQTMIYCNEDDARKFIKLKEDKGNNYKGQKEEFSEIIEKVIISEFPILKDKLKCLDVWTPATYKRYVNSEIGSFMGFALPKNVIPLKIPNTIKGVNNVFLATQWQQTPGGLPIAAKLGKEAIESINNRLEN